MKKRFTILIALTTLCLPMAVSAEMLGRIAAVVNDDPVTTFEVEKEQKSLEKALEQNPSSVPADKENLRKTALDSVVNKRLISQKIRELDIRISDEEVKQAIEDVKRQNNITQETLVAALNNQGLSFDEYKSQLREQLERLRLVSQEVRSKIQITDQETRAYYNANLNKFQMEGTFRALLITVAVPENASKEERSKRSNKISTIYSEAKGGTDFGELAKKYSDDPSAKDGGDLGSFKHGEMVDEFEEVLKKLNPGEISEPFTTGTGFHIVKLVERSTGKAEPYEKVKAQIEDTVYKKKSEERFNQWLADLRKNAAVEIRDSAL